MLWQRRKESAAAGGGNLQEARRQQLNEEEEKTTTATTNAAGEGIRRCPRATTTLCSVRVVLLLHCLTSLQPAALLGCSPSSSLGAQRTKDRPPPAARSEQRALAVSPPYTSLGHCGMRRL